MCERLYRLVRESDGRERTDAEEYWCPRRDETLEAVLEPEEGWSGWDTMSGDWRLYLCVIVCARIPKDELRGVALGVVVWS